MSSYKPISCNYHSVIEHYATKKIFCRLQYYTDINEFITVNTLITDVYTESGEEFIKISDGSFIRLDRIVRIDDEAAPGYDDKYFKCDC